MPERKWFKVQSGPMTQWINLDAVNHSEIHSEYQTVEVYTTDSKTSICVLEEAEAAELLGYIDQRAEFERGQWQGLMNQLVQMVNQARQAREAARMEGAHRA